MSYSLNIEDLAYFGRVMSLGSPSEDTPWHVHWNKLAHRPEGSITAVDKCSVVIPLIDWKQQYQWITRGVSDLHYRIFNEIAKDAGKMELRHLWTSVISRIGRATNDPNEITREVEKSLDAPGGEYRPTNALCLFLEPWLMKDSLIVASRVQMFDYLDDYLRNNLQHHIGRHMPGAEEEIAHKVEEALASMGITTKDLHYHRESETMSGTLQFPRRIEYLNLTIEL